MPRTLLLMGLVAMVTTPARADIKTVDSLAALIDRSPLVVEATVKEAKQWNGHGWRNGPAGRG